jgi:hypothetical protein
MSKIFLFFCFVALVVGVLTQKALYALGTLGIGVVIKVLINLVSQ